MTLRSGSFHTIALALCTLTSGCGFISEFGPATCDRSESTNPPIRYTEGTVENGVYDSTLPSGELLYFPGGMRYRVEHQLGSEPRWTQVYLSFDRYGTETGTMAQAAGNQAELKCSDER